MKHKLCFTALLLLSQLCISLQGYAEDLKQLNNVAYGSHPRQVLDFYPAKSGKPTPVAFYIPGGGWQSRDKGNRPNPKTYLDKGISLIAINYRYVRNAVEDNIRPPVKAPLHDAARALQFVRSKATEWNLDKNRFGATGDSAGGFTSLWLAFHDEMANPNSGDPIARESTRLSCAAVSGAQVSLDPKVLREWMPNYDYGSHAFGLASFASLLENREQLLAWIQEYSPIEHVSSDDPPIAMFYKGDNPIVGASPDDSTHSGIMGVKLEEKLRAVDVDVVLVHPGRSHPIYKYMSQYLTDCLSN